MNQFFCLNFFASKTGKTTACFYAPRKYYEVYKFFFGKENQKNISQETTGDHGKPKA